MSVTSPPGPIRVAVRLMWAGAAVGVLSLVVGIGVLSGAKDDIREDLVKDDPNVSQSKIDAVQAIGIAFVVVLGVLGVVLWSWMAWKNGQGRPWARIVATVLGGLNLLSTLLSLVAPNPYPGAILFSLANAMLAIAVVILLWRKQSSEFYAERSRLGAVPPDGLN